MFAGEIKKLQADKLKPQEQLTLEPYERDHAVVVGTYRWVGMAPCPQIVIVTVNKSVIIGWVHSVYST